MLLTISKICKLEHRHSIHCDPLWLTDPGTFCSPNLTFLFWTANNMGGHKVNQEMEQLFVLQVRSVLYQSNRRKLQYLVNRSTISRLINIPFNLQNWVKNFKEANELGATYSGNFFKKIKIRIKEHKLIQNHRESKLKEWKQER